MSTYRKEGKDVIIFATPDDHKEPSNVKLPEPENEPQPLILENGEVNWDCPCLGGIPTGPCGVEFREAFTCFYRSTAERRGEDCVDLFNKLHLCFAEYPQLYNFDNDDEDADEENLDIKLTDEEKALISDNKVGKDVSAKAESSSSSSSKPDEKVSGKVEEKTEEKQTKGVTDTKKSSPSTGKLQINA